MATVKNTTYDGNYAIDTFTGAGTISWTVPTSITSVDIFVVGGGCGGTWIPDSGWAWSGKHGAINNISTAVSGTYAITVGAGTSFNSITNGGTSSVGSLISAAGGDAWDQTGDINGYTDTYWGVSLSNVGGGGALNYGNGVNGVVLIRYLSPTVVQRVPTSVTTTSFTANAEITELVSGTASRRGFCYKSGTSTPTTSDTTVYDDDAFIAEAYSKSITGLSVATNYTIRPYFIRSGVTWYGNKITVKTLSLTADILDVTGDSLAGWTDADTGVGVSETIANFESTALWTDTQGAGIGNFSGAPNGQVCYCNGVDSVIWGGDETKISAFITSTAAVGNDGIVTSPNVLTAQMQNTKTDSDNVAYIGGGIDSHVVLMLHGDGANASTTILDSETAGAAKTVTAVGNAQLDTAQAKFGVSSILFDGTGDYLTVPDSADWYFGTGDFTIDAWLNTATANAYQGICGQYVDTDNYWVFYFRTQVDGKVIFYFKIVSGGTTKADYVSNGASFNGILNTFGHVELVRNGANIYIFLNGISLTLTANTAITTNAVPDLAAVLTIGAAGNNNIATWWVLDGWLDEFRISKGVARHTANFTPRTTPYAPKTNVFLVGSTRPLQGIKPYVLIGNTTVSATTGKVWAGVSWDSLTLTDNTDTGASLAQTGKISFTSTVGTAVPKYIEGYYLFWYQFSLDAGDATIYQVTVDAPMQPVVNLWDGIYRSLAAYYRSTTASNVSTRTDETVNIYKYEYDSTNPLTYSVLTSLAATGCLEFAFTEKMTALSLFTATGYHNTTAGTTASVYYWDGTGYVTVGAITDGTSLSGISLAQNGVISWNNTTISGERQKALEGGNLFYFYQVQFNQTLSATRLFYAAGISVVEYKSGYAFSIHAADRLMLGCDTTGEKNSLLISAENQPDVFNGRDSYKVLVGDDNALTCGTSIFAQYASNIYNMALIFKQTETWSLVWTQGATSTNWTRFNISPNIGCPAPRTLKTVSATFENNVNTVKVIAIWRAEDGIYVSNGQAPLKVSLDIEDVFDQTKPVHVCLSMVDRETAFVDNHLLEYHWKFATDLCQISVSSGASAPTVGSTITGNTSGAIGIVNHLGTIAGAWGSGTASGLIYFRPVSGTWQAGETMLSGTTVIATTASKASLSPVTENTLNKEYILDLKNWQWFEIDRETGNRLQLGIEVSDTLGNSYNFGFLDTGYMERLEYGTDFDGTDITHTLETGDQIHVEKDVLMKTSLVRINIIAIAKNTDSTVTFTHTMDSSTISNDYILSVADATHRYANVISDVFSTPGIFHSYKFVAVTSNETKGFEPLCIAAYYHRIRDHII